MPPIDRINGMSPVDGTQNNRRVQDAGSTETGNFSLPEDSEGVIYEPGSAIKSETKTISQIREEIAREEAAKAKANLHSRFDGYGVTVELSTDGVAATEMPQKQPSIGSILKDSWNSLVNFFLSIWNGGAAQPAVKDEVPYTGLYDEEAEESIKEPEEVSGTDPDKYGDDGFVPFMNTRERDEKTEQIPEQIPERTVERTPVRTNSPEDMAAFMADYGGGRLAKNSDLLTQYDRRGQIVSVDPSDRRRILQGQGRIRRY
ncbi:MAG: hypothetical protein K6G12_05830 [Lachnospiraceae bacterium]|nr:hypothetical protein [Lachnospiraceae bacterium]